ncbi:MAG: FliI/YscN family ATPase [Planctomycetes bacterium]|nr:FliI/YscN family ATPase [Planctomycetota bacterium]
MQHLTHQIPNIMSVALTGCVVRTEGAATAVAGLPAPVGSLVEIERQAGQPVTGEVIGFREELTLVCPFGDMAGVRYGNRVRLVRTSRFLRTGDGLLGRVINAHGAMIDGRPEPLLPERTLVHRCPPPAFDRPRIQLPMTTGVRAIDGLLPCGRGQRLGIFSGSGVGKSVLLGMLARHSESDVNVIALIGERGREVKQFIETNLGPDGLRKSVIVVATSDEPALLRLQAAMTATTVAEYFRDRGKHVLLAMDSLSRFAMAQREIGLAAGETPATRGYPASVFGTLPKLLERAGPGEHGSITAFYTVLVEGDDLNEPLSDAARSLLDGHLVLSRQRASSGVYPAIDVLESDSRLARDVASPEHLAAISQIRAWLAAYRDHSDVIAIGAYRNGSNPALDAAIRAQNAVDRYLRQTPNETAGDTPSRDALLQLVKQITDGSRSHQAA